MIEDYLQDGDVNLPATDEQPAPGLAAYAEQEPAAAPAAGGGGVEPFTDAEVASFVAQISSYGLPIDALTDYQQAFIARSGLAFTALQLGEALAAYGIGKGGVFDNVPPWMRLAAGVVVIGGVVVVTRREFSGGVPAASPGGSGVAEVGDAA